MVQKLDEKGIVPPCTLDFSAHRSGARVGAEEVEDEPAQDGQVLRGVVFSRSAAVLVQDDIEHPMQLILDRPMRTLDRSEEHTSELQSRGHLVCRLLLEKKKE